MADSESVDSPETPPTLGANASAGGNTTGAIVSAEGNTTAVGKICGKKEINISFICAPLIG